MGNPHRRECLAAFGKDPEGVREAVRTALADGNRKLLVAYIRDRVQEAVRLELNAIQPREPARLWYTLEEAGQRLGVSADAVQLDPLGILEFWVIPPFGLVTARQCPELTRARRLREANLLALDPNAADAEREQ